MIYACIFSSLCFLLSCIGASGVFFIKNIKPKTQAVLNAFSSGVMIASSIFSLLIPATEYCAQLGMKDFIVLPLSYIFAYLTLVILDLFHKNNTSKTNSHLVSLGMCLHNIPEGMCIGFAFALSNILKTRASFISAIMIALGIGIQNIPEGMSVAFPKVCDGKTRKSAFFTSMLMAVVEIPAGIIAYLIGLKFLFILPFMLAYSSAIMIFVASLDLMPNAVSNNKNIALFSIFLGFAIMMILDLAL